MDYRLQGRHQRWVKGTAGTRVIWTTNPNDARPLTFDEAAALAATLAAWHIEVHAVGRVTEAHGRRPA